MTKARIISFLMVVCLATTCMLSGTVAKYTTSDSATDSATVGKWGVTLGIDGSLFAKNYKTTDNTPTNETTGISVKASGSSDLVAPGTKNANGMTITLTGTPEVSVKVSVKASGTDVYLNEGTYAILVPVNKDSVTAENFADRNLYTVNGTTVTKLSNFGEVAGATNLYTFDDEDKVVVSGKYLPIDYVVSTDNTLTSVEAIVNKLNNQETTIDISGGVNLSTAQVNGVTLNGAKISWDWDYEDSKDGEDTILGALIAGQMVVAIDGGNMVLLTVTNDSVKNGSNEVGYLETSLTLTITVDQVD